MNINVVLLIIGFLVTGIGSVMLILINQVLTSIKELKEEINVLKTLNSRIASLEEFREHFKGCINLKTK